VADARRFDRLVDDAMTSLPPSLLAHLDAVDVVVDEVPPDDEGDVPLGRWATTATGDRLVLFRRPLEARARDRSELTELIRETVVLEVAAHLGIDDDRLDDLGWG
jgi:predicted Zn-dependent protease with MMP-like domain